jgi:rhodanese-related sulfurtransferase
MGYSAREPNDEEWSVSEISQHDFAAVRQHGHVQLVDVREDGEFTSGHVPGAASIPMGEVTHRLAELDPTRPVYVICATGRRSAITADALMQRGFDAYSVLGGTSAWARSGHRVDYGVDNSTAQRK